MKFLKKTIEENLCLNEIKNYNIQLLAYIGDAIYELLTRKHYFNNNLKQKSIHKKTTNIVNACSQAIAYDNIITLLNSNELNFIKKAKNFKNKNIPKHLKISIYAKSTAIEALFGFLYFNHQFSRINFIYQTIVTIYDKTH